ncbi:mannosyltransferase [Altibacter sp.]|uniref:mannosyltransferase n=1 Tax=Altibacter sp. TaxID=2024823 RepID=UPI000C98BB31|nr:mannosyltransferase [Altibacter sp.]MAP55314.1 mannosyltransferase [Altibacter sp.]
MRNALKSRQIPLLFAGLSVVFYSVFAYDLERWDFVKLGLLYAALFFLTYKLIQVGKGNYWWLIGFGVAFRLAFIGSLPNLSQDFYRFLWDGRLLAQGFSPYLFTPESYMQLPSSYDVVIPQAAELYKGMGSLNASHYSNYPPLNQLFFTIAAAISGSSILGSVITLRLLLIFADLGILFIGKKLLESLELDPYVIFWYFLNPFIIIELTGNLHFDGAMLLFLLLFLYLLRRGLWQWAAAAMAASISVKLIPLLFLPLLFHWFQAERSAFKGVTRLLFFYGIVLGVVLLSFLPFLSSEFISHFSATIGLWFQNFEFNASVYYIIRWIGFQTVGWNIIGTAGKILPLIVLIAVLLLVFLRKNTSIPQLCTGMLWAISVYLMLATTVHPWYIATPLLLCLFTPYRFPVVWSAFIIVSYTAYGADGFREKLGWVTLEYVVVIGYAVWEIILQHKKRKLPSVSH